MTAESPTSFGLEAACDLLYREAELLDDRDLDGWIDLFCRDAIYWLPQGDEDPETQASLIFDDRERMEERVYRLLDTMAYAQLPPSRTQHDVSNIRVMAADATTAQVRCNLVVHEVRLGDPSQVGLGQPRSFAGRCTYDLRQVDGRWLIAKKVVRLLDRESPQFNLTFII